MTREEDIRARLDGTVAWTTVQLLHDIDYLLQENERLRGALEWIADLLEHREYADGDMLDQIDHKASQALEGEAK